MKLKSVLSALATVLLMPLAASAQTLGTDFTYQGSLKQSGAPLSSLAGSGNFTRLSPRQPLTAAPYVHARGAGMRPDSPQDALSASDWSGIRAAYESRRCAVHALQ